MHYKEIRAALTAHFSKALANSKARIDQDGPLSQIDSAAYRNGYAFAQEGIDGNSSIDPTVVGDDGLADWFVEKYHLPIERGTKAYEHLRTDLKPAYRDYCRAVSDYNASLSTYDFASPTVAVPTEPVSSAITIKELWNKYSTEAKRGGQWAAKTEIEKTAHVELLIEMFGPDFDIGAMKVQEVQRVKSVLDRYPKNRNKNPATRNRRLSEALAVEGVDVLDVKSLNKYLQTFGTMFRWALNNGFVERNYFDGLAIRQTARNKADERKPFSDAQVGVLLNEVLNNPRGKIKRPYQKWGPLIGLYTGARLNEISQLHLADFQQEDEIWYIHITDEGDGDKKFLKTEASRRKTPIHPDLVTYGLLQHVEDMKAAGETKLFPDFSYCPKNGWGRSLGRWFNNTLLPELNMKEAGLVFHSLRHTVVTRLRQAGVAADEVYDIVGHTRQGVENKNYFKEGYKLPLLAVALSKLPYSGQQPALGRRDVDRSI